MKPIEYTAQQFSNDVLANGLAKAYPDRFRRARFCRSLLWRLKTMHKKSLGVFVALAAGLSLTLADPLPAHAEEEYTVIPLLVNVLEGVPITIEDMENMVKEANKILKKAKIRLEFDKKNIRPQFDDQGDNDGEVDIAEEPMLVRQGLEELERRFGRGKGYKITIANGIFDNELIGGATLHDPDKPNTFLRPLPTTGDAARGNDLAHEVAHNLTLGPQHLIDDQNDADPGNDVQADATGHAVEEANLMFPHNDGETIIRGTELTDDQIEEIKDKAKVRGDTKLLRTETGAITPLHTLHGSWLGFEAFDLPPYIDITGGGFFAAGPEAELRSTIQLRGLFPAAQRVEAEYNFFFNIDNDENTGLPFGDLKGSDRQVFVKVAGLFPFNRLDDINQAGIIDLISGNVADLPPAIFDRVEKIIDGSPSDFPKAFDLYDKIELLIALPLLGPLADEVRVGIQAFDLTTEQFDAQPMVPLTIRKPLGPQMTLEAHVATPGTPILVSGMRYTPGRPFEVLLDDTPAGSGTVSDDGTLSTTFNFPTVPGGDYFLTVRDDADQSDFSILQSDSDLPPQFEVIGLLTAPNVLLTRVRDQDSGLKRIKIVKQTNLEVAQPSFTRGTTSPVVMTAEKIDPSKKGELKMKLSDMTGHTFTSRATFLSLSIGGAGEPLKRVLRRVAEAQSQIRVHNATPGLDRLDIRVNDQQFQIKGLDSDAETTLDVSSAMQPGKKNKIKITAQGSAGTSANVVVSN